MEHLWCAPFLRPHLLLLVARWNTCTRWSTRPSISSLARGEYWRRQPGGEGLWGAACCWGGPYSLQDTHTLILSQEGQAALLGAGRWGKRGHWLQDPPGGGGPRGELSLVRGRRWQWLLGSAPELSVSPQFLSLDDLPDSGSNVDLRTDHAPNVSAPPLWVGWV